MKTARLWAQKVCYLPSHLANSGLSLLEPSGGIQILLEALGPASTLLWGPSSRDLEDTHIHLDSVHIRKVHGQMQHEIVRFVASHSR